MAVVFKRVVNGILGGINSFLNYLDEGVKKANEDICRYSGECEYKRLRPLVLPTTGYSSIGNSLNPAVVYIDFCAKGNTKECEKLNPPNVFSEDKKILTQF